MNKSSFLLICAVFITIGFVMAGCGFLDAPAAEQPTEDAEVPTAAAVEEQQEGGEVTENGNAEIPSSDQDFVYPAGTIITDISQIEGTWIAAAYPGNFVMTIYPDGRLSVATSLEDLEAGSTDTWQLTIEDGEIIASGFALCPGDVGTYIGSIKYNDLLRFTSVIDPCDARLRKMDRSLPGRLNEYILLFYPVY